MTDCGILDLMGLRLPKIEKRLGPFTYERDEYRFWHRFGVGSSIRVSVQADIFTPAFVITAGNNVISVEGAFYPPQWVHELADFSKWAASELKASFDEGYRRGINIFGSNEKG